MRSKRSLAWTVSFALAAVVIAQDSRGGKKDAPASKPSDLIHMTAAELTWTDLDPDGAPGVKVADLWGDHTKGAYGALFKLPAGFAVPLHTHTHDIKVVMVSGTYIQVPEGKSEFRLGPGSYMMQPGGDYRHTTSCDKSADCVFFAESGGKFDLMVVPAKVAAASRD